MVAHLVPKTTTIRTGLSSYRLVEECILNVKIPDSGLSDPLVQQPTQKIANLLKSSWVFCTM